MSRWASCQYFTLTSWMNRERQDCVYSIYTLLVLYTTKKGRKSTRLRMRTKRWMLFKKLHFTYGLFSSYVLGWDESWVWLSSTTYRCAWLDLESMSRDAYDMRNDKLKTSSITVRIYIRSFGSRWTAWLYNDDLKEIMVNTKPICIHIRNEK